MEKAIVNALARLGMRADTWIETETQEVFFRIDVRGPDDPLVATTDDAAALAPEPYARLSRDALVLVEDNALTVTVMQRTMQSWDARMLARFAVDVAAVARALQPSLAEPFATDREPSRAQATPAAESAVGGPSGASVAVSRTKPK